MPRLRKATSKTLGPRSVRKVAKRVVVKTVAVKKGIVVKKAGPKRGRGQEGRGQGGRPVEVSALPARTGAAGVKLLRIWVPDPKSPDFAKEAERQGALLRGRPEEEAAIRFAEAVYADSMADEPDYDW